MKRKRPSNLLLAFWIVGFGILAFRCVYDLKLYYFGGTVVVRPPASVHYDYLLHFPKGYRDSDGPRPLILFLHGSGEINRDVRKIKGHDPYYFANGVVDAEDFPFLVVAPVSPRNGWNPDDVVAFLDELLADHRVRYRIDPSRIYLTGHSMGGFATFMTAAKYPDRFAAVVPLAGGCEPSKAERLFSVPIWAFHGNADRVVRAKQTRAIMAELRRQHHSDARFSMLYGWGHGIGRPVYSNPKLYRWLLQHTNDVDSKMKEELINSDLL